MSVFEAVNTVLRSPWTYPDKLAIVQAYAFKLIEALVKLPMAPGEFYRKTDLPDTVVKLAASSGRFVDSGFLSCSSEPIVFRGRDLLSIYGQRARSIEAVSFKPEEREVVFVPGTRFSVDGMAKEGDKNLLRLVELDVQY